MKFFKIFFLIFLILAATVGGAAWRLIEVFPLPDPNPRPNPQPLPIDLVKGVTYVLIVGLDDVDGGRRSDAIALAAVDRDGKAIRILSIPRDSRVYIPNRGWDKVNHAYAYGGVELLKDTVKNLLNIGIDYFVVVNYQSFPRIIDLIGGIDIDVDKKLVYTDYSAKLFINIPKGQQHMNGKTALEYVRFRNDPLGDIGRVQRQQKFIGIVMDKLKSPSILPKVPDLIAEIVSALNTDLTPREAIGLMLFANSLPPDRIQMQMAFGKASYIGNLSYWTIDITKTSQWLAGEIEEPFAEEAASADVPPPDLNRDMLMELVGQIGKIGVLNGDGASGLGRRAAQIFQRIGVDVVYTGNARHFDYHTSNVIYPENATESDKQAAEALAKLCGITNKALIQKNRTAAMVSIVLGHDKENVFKRLENIDF